jgi:very-short-patch-repair endonuclease
VDPTVRRDLSNAGRCTVAAAWFEVPGGRADVIEITCKRWERTRASGLVVHEQRRLTEEDIIEIDGISLVRPELLVMQLAWWKPVPTYVEAVIHALRRKRLISYSSTHQMFIRHARRGLRGVAATRVALDWWNPANAATESEMETLLLQTFRAHDLSEPVLQYEVYDANGQLVARTDAGLPQWKVVVEYQSMQEHLDEFQAARDDRRRNKILAAGYYPLMARAADLRAGGDELVEEILAIARREREA